jgi:ParB-like chromosome segregation protein Spo0J
MTTTPSQPPETVRTPDSAAPQVLWLAPAALGRSLAPLRRGRLRPSSRALAEQPLRAFATRGGGHEVVDGFQRLERWEGAGAQLVPVVVEVGLTEISAKRALLAANAPARTLSIMDEARVVASLRHEDGLGPKTIANVLGRKPAWVTRRLALSTGLSPAAERRVDAGRIGPSVAHALCGLRQEDQDELLAVVERERLRARETLALITALRDTEIDARPSLLRDPLPVVRPPSAPATSSTAARLEERLRRAREVLAELGQLLALPGDLTPVERRRLEAERRLVLHQLQLRAEELAGPPRPALDPPARQEKLHDHPEPSRPLSEPVARRSDPAPLPPAAGLPWSCTEPGERDTRAVSHGEHTRPDPGGAGQGAPPAYAGSRDTADRREPGGEPSRGPQAPPRGGAPRTGEPTQDAAPECGSGEQARSLPRARGRASPPGPDGGPDPARAA